MSSAQTTIVPKTTWIPSKKLSPIIMTVDPPLVHPSLGLIALIHGVAVKGTASEEGNKMIQMYKSFVSHTMSPRGSSLRESFGVRHEQEQRETTGEYTTRHFTSNLSVPHLLFIECM